jgi:hypothetical protein
MTQVGIDTTVSFERVRSGVRIGVLRDLEPREINGDEILVGRLERVVKGATVAETISVRGDALLALRGILVEGASVRLWGDIHSDYFKVRGPDATHRTLVRELKKLQDEADAKNASPATRSLQEKRRRAMFARKRRLATAA